MKSVFITITNCLLLIFSSNSPLIIYYFNAYYLIPVSIAAFLTANLLNYSNIGKYRSGKIKICAHGVERLKAFLFSSVVSLIIHISALVLSIPWFPLLISGIVCIFAHCIVFWNGMISVYISSTQLGIHHRLMGIFLAFIPVLNIIELIKIIAITTREIKFEEEKEKVNTMRAEKKVCRTRYPILLVHGVFFRDSKKINYWGRIPGELERNGAVIFYGNHHSASSVSDSARELTDRIKEIVNQTGCGKVNIIAHSKGGLDCRYAISFCGAEKYVASLTTINTPHRGCGFADYLLKKIPENVQKKIADTYNTSLKKLGDTSPDFIEAVTDLTEKNCEKLNRIMEKENEKFKGIFCQSVGSKLNRRTSGKFPLNFTYDLVKYFDGPNDGLVSEKSFQWGEKYTFLTVKGKRGISHGDMVDLNRENIEGFDVREFYVNLVFGLKSKGL